MKTIIVILVLLFSFSSWAVLKPLNEYPIEDIDYDTELAIEIGTRCLAIFKWSGTYESKQYAEMWLQFLFPLLVKDPTQGEAEFKKLQSSVEPIIRNIREDTINNSLPFGRNWIPNPSYVILARRRVTSNAADCKGGPNPRAIDLEHCLLVSAPLTEHPACAAPTDHLSPKTK